MIRVNPQFKLICTVVFAAGVLMAQGRGGRGGAAPQPVKSPHEAAPIDITGYWVSLVTGDWRFRMITPPKGDYTAIPLNPEGRKVADAWDPAKDEAAGEQCKAYGAPAVMRLPGRLHIIWQDDQNLKMEMDAGTQTRVFSFGVPVGQSGSWQGISKAVWEYLPAPVTTTDGARTGVGRVDPTSGSLKVVTTNLRAGYLRRNGVPYSSNVVLTEYFDKVTEPNGDVYLIVTTTVDDPTYLASPLMVSTHFKKQADGTGWNPTPCSAR